MDRKEFDLYKDIQGRTNGEIYIGVVGPVRTGKSTFIKRFMELCVIPEIDNEYSKKRAIDELPQSGQGKTIMTTEPKFIPQEAAKISLEDGTDIRLRMVDCVGFTVSDAYGYSEGDEERMVKTPWFYEDVPFEEAAVVGTQKVISEHSTIAVLVTTDGSIGDIKRESYENAERETVAELCAANKPFIIVLNTRTPFAEETLELKSRLENEYKVAVAAINCSQMQHSESIMLLEKILYEFSISHIDFFIPRWVEMLDYDNHIKQTVIKSAMDFLHKAGKIKDVIQNGKQEENTQDEIVKRLVVSKIDLSDGCVSVKIEIDEKYYYENISNLSNTTIKNEEELISLITELTSVKAEYEKVKDAFTSVQQKGYGVVMPELEDITMEDPVLIAHGNKYGVKMKALSPSIHMIRANIETEIAPIVGNREQAEDLITYIKDGEKSGDGVWGTNIFGKSIGELMEDGIRSKIMQRDDEGQMKLQETMQKIVNDSNGGMICIII